MRSFNPDDDLRGRADVKAFTVDTTPPKEKPTIANPAEKGFVSENPYYEFEPATGEAEYGYQCKFDEDIDKDTAAFADCAEGRTHPLDEGPHQLRILPIDGAGNIGTSDSESELVNFTVGEDPTEGADPVENSNALSHPNSWASYARGLHIASGAIEAPDGKLWVSDHNGGFCRIVDPTPKASGRLDHPERAGQAGNRTCLGGLLPEARAGADAAGQPAFVDPTPRKPGSGDEVVIVPDGATKQRALWRAQWNPGSKRFDPLDEFLGATDPADPDRGPRPTAAATGVDPDGPTKPKQAAVYYVTQTSPWIVRINNPASANPTTDVVGYANDGGRSRRAGESIAVGSMAGPDGEKRDVIYVGEAGGVTRVIPSEAPLPLVTEDDVVGDPALQPFIASPVALEGIVTNAGLAYDRAREQLYVGTAEAVSPAPTDVGSDSVRRYQVKDVTAASATHELMDEIGEFPMIGGLGLRADGHLLVVDDVALITNGEPMGTGRLYQVGSPVARIASGPSNVDGQTALNAAYTANRSPEFGLVGDSELECWLREAGSTADPAFEACGTTFAPAATSTTARTCSPSRPSRRRRPSRSTRAGQYPVVPIRPVPDTLGFTVDGAGARAAQAGRRPHRGHDQRGAVVHVHRRRRRDGRRVRLAVQPQRGRRDGVLAGSLVPAGGRGLAAAARGQHADGAGDRPGREHG